MSKKLLIGGAAIVVLLIALRPDRGQRNKPIKTRPVAGENTPGTHPSFAPDASKIVYSSRPDDSRYAHIYVKARNTAPVQLTDAQSDDLYPVWSPDGSTIAFARQSDSGLQYMTVPASGGTPKSVGAADLKTDPAPPLGWAGRHLIAVTPKGLVVLDDSNKPLTKAGTDESDWAPSGSPDGTRVVFYRRSNPERGDLFIVPITGGTPTQLTFDNHGIEGVCWSGAEIFFATRRTGDPELWRISPDGGSPHQLLDPGRNVHYPAVSSDGKHLAFYRSARNVNTWRLDLSNGKSAPLLDSAFDERQTQYSPDGKKIVYLSNRGGSDQIWIAAADASSPKQLTNYDDGRIANPRWSPDGKSIALAREAEDGRFIDIVDTNGKLRKQSGSLDRELDFVVPVWTRDGKLIYFTHHGQTWRMDAETGAVRAISQRRAFGLAMDPDGEHLLVVSFPHIVRRPLEGQGEERVVDGIRPRDPRFVAQAGNNLYFMEGTRVLRVELKSGTLKDVAVLPVKGSGGGTFSVSPDEKSLLFARTGESRSEIVFLDGFR